MKTKKQIQGKKARAAGARFELKVRKDLESKGWVVSKWMNNVELTMFVKEPDIEYEETKERIDVKVTRYEAFKGRLISAKHKFCGIGRPMAIGTGFPDFVIMTDRFHLINMNLLDNQIMPGTGLKKVYGLEVKSNGYLDKIEKEKCAWILKNQVFSKIIIASKGKKRGEIEYVDFK